MAGGKQRATGGNAGGDVFDVRVVAFAGGSARTLQALQDLFGLDREGAQRVVDNVPLVVRRAAPANEAQTFATALRGIGAQVALERPGTEHSAEPQRPAVAAPVPVARRAPPPPPKAAAPPAPPRPPGPPPVPRDADPLPKPVMRAMTADLEYDFASSGEPAREPKSETHPVGGGARGGKRSRNDIEFGAGADDKLELDDAAVRGATSERSGGRTLTGMDVPVPPRNLEARAEPPAQRLSSPEIPRDLAPLSRAAVVHKPGVSTKVPPSPRSIAALRVLIGVGVGVLGIVFDNSIVYGNANLLSVAAHAFGIYQLGVGLRGFVS